MIQLEITDEIIRKHNDWVFGKNKKDSRRLYSKLEKAVNSEKNSDVRSILNKILNKLEDIITGKLDYLDKIRREFDIDLVKLKAKDTKKIIKKEDKKVEVGINEEHLFNVLNIFLKEYKYFYGSVNWNAYIFQKDLDLSICPYCGTQFIFLYYSDDGKTRGTLDHYYDKATYPFLAVSIYNLVPACKVCNSDFKGTEPMNLIEYYSPYEEKIVDYISFKRQVFPTYEKLIKPEDVDTEVILSEKTDDDIDYYAIFTGLSEDFNIKIDYSNAPKSPINIYEKIKGNIELFHLENIYNTYHKNYVQKIIQKAYIYNYVYRESLKNTYIPFFESENEVRLSLYSPLKDDKNIILGKLTRDIIENEIKNFKF